jgi:3-dehydroquinate dehydratase-2
MAASESTPKKTILLLNGPNLNLLGTREPHIYGHTTLSQVEADAKARASELNATLMTFQSNHEGALIDRIQAARTEGVDGIIINPAGFTHTSVAIRDALLGVDIPFVELHVSNIHARPEQWRHHSYFSDKAQAVIMGCGVHGYKLAVEHVAVNFASRKIHKIRF